MDNTEIFELWIEEYTQRLVRLAYTYVRDWAAAEDRVQDAFLKAYRASSQLQNNQAPFPWLARIVINECKMHYRRSWREVITSLMPERKELSTESIYFSSQQLTQLHEAVLALPERFSVPVILYYFDEIPVKQIANILGISAGTVKSRLARGRRRLRKKYEEDDCQHGRETQGGEVPLQSHR